MSYTPLCVHMQMQCCCSVAKSCLTLCNPMGCSMPAFSILHYPQSLLKLMFIESMMLSNHLILCCPLSLLPSIFPSIKVFSTELALRIRWPKYWGFSLSPSNEYSGLTYYRTDWFLKEINPKEYFVIDPK